MLVTNTDVECIDKAKALIERYFAGHDARVHRFISFDICEEQGPAFMKVTVLSERDGPQPESTRLSSHLFDVFVHGELELKPFGCDTWIKVGDSA